MEILRYEKQLPPEALAIRMEVFCEEQGFTDEVDEIDREATHLLLLDGGVPRGTCRVFRLENTYFLGRLAVLRSDRGRGLGALLVKEAEKVVREKGGDGIRLHAQCRAMGFYTAQGYTPVGEEDEDQGCPHMWMEKKWALPPADGCEKQRGE